MCVVFGIGMVRQLYNCKFAMPVNRIVLTEAIEILDCTAKAQQSIEEVKEWKVE